MTVLNLSVSMTLQRPQLLDLGARTAHPPSATCPEPGERMKTEQTVVKLPVKLESSNECDDPMDTVSDRGESNGDSPISNPGSESFEDQCSICLHQIVDRTIVPICSHEFCFECLLIWCDQSRRCPLCSQAIGDHIIHQIRSTYDYQKHHLTPLRSSSPKPLQAQAQTAIQDRRRSRSRRERRWEARDDDLRRANDRLERSIEKRRWIYKHRLYAKHIASNAYTRYRPYPTPAQFASSPEMIRRVTMFLRRELRVWVNLDVEFLTTYILSVMKDIDIRSESAVKLLSEFLDMDTPYVPGDRRLNAEQFAHEVYSFTRSPYKDLFVYDSVVQYDAPVSSSPPRVAPVTTFWEDQETGISSSTSAQPAHERGESLGIALPSGSRDGRDSTRRARLDRKNVSRSPSMTRDSSWSPSGRKYPSSTREDGRGATRHISESRSSKRRKAGSDTEEGPYTRRNEDRPRLLSNSKGKGRQRSTSPVDYDGLPPPSTDVQESLTSFLPPGPPSAAPAPAAELKIKGMGREDVCQSAGSSTSGPIKIRRPSMIHEHELQGNHSNSTLDNPTSLNAGAASSRLHRVDLVQSVHRHLKLNSGSSRSQARGDTDTPPSNANVSSAVGSRQEDEATRGKERPRMAPDLAIPNLLARLSDPSEVATGELHGGRGGSRPPDEAGVVIPTDGRETELIRQRRALLLSRIEKERREAEQNTLGPSSSNAETSLQPWRVSDENVPFQDHDLEPGRKFQDNKATNAEAVSSSAGKSERNTDIDTTAVDKDLEVRLKSRVRLQAKLAAAKRGIEGGCS